MGFVFHVATVALLYATAAAGLSVIVRTAGLVSLAHPVFVAVGAYGATILAARYHLSFLPAVALAIALAGALAWLVVGPLCRLSGEFFVLGTFAIITVAASLATNLTALTGGPMGLSNRTDARLWGMSMDTPRVFLFMVLGVCILIVLVTRKFVLSLGGIALRAQREAAVDTALLGYDVARLRRWAFSLGAAAAGATGALMIFYERFIDPSVLSLDAAMLYLSFTLLFSAETPVASAIGALLLVMLQEALRLATLPALVAANLRVIIVGGAVLLILSHRGSSFESPDALP